MTFEMYESPRERQRKVRVAIGKICRCRQCYCCEEWLKEEARQHEQETQDASETRIWIG